MEQWLSEMKQNLLSWLSSWLSEKHLSWINEHFMWIVIIVVIIIGAILGSIYRSRKLKKRAESLKELGPQKPFHSLPNENVISKFKKPTGVMKFHNGDDVLKCFFEGESMNFAQGNVGSIDFVTYDYEYSKGGGPEGWERTFRGTAILLQSDQLVLPSFKWGSSSLDVRKRVQPGRPPKAKEEAGFKQCPTCGSLDVRRKATIESGGIIKRGYWCEHCKKSLYKMYEEMNKEKVHKLFEFVSIADLQGLTALASNTQLMLYRDSWVPAEKYQEFIDKAINIFQMFQSASQNLNEHA